jgi:hypothetical protein
MPDDDYDDPDLDQEESGTVKALRKQLKDAEKQAHEANGLRTENALLKAGLGDLSDIQRKAILATHDGETTAEALTATATSLGFVKAPEPVPQVPADEVAAHQRAAEATQGAEASGAQVVTLDEKIRAARTPEELDDILRSAGQLQTTE